MRHFVFGRHYLGIASRLPITGRLWPSESQRQRQSRPRNDHWIQKVVFAKHKKRRQQESESTASRSHIDIGQSPGNLTDVFFKAHNSLVSRSPLSLAN